VSDITDKQEKYCQYRMQGMSQRQAYKKAYPNNKQSDEAIDIQASRLEKNGKVKARLQELREKVQKKGILTVQQILELLTKDAQSGELKAQDRHRAMDMILKVNGAYVQNLNMNANVDMKVEDYIKKVESESEYRD
jgi:phage terminase small subunit